MFQKRDRPAFSGHEFIANGIVLAVGMLTAIDLDDQGSLSAGKVSEIRTDWKLPNEFEAVQPKVAKFRPKFCLGIVVRLPKHSCALCRFRFRTAHLIVPMNGPSP
ncbi:hypothetical protein FHX05_001004 [Rhizobium sp. BK491]|nr:hypothetical protein [Rhizobium sp. BK491]